MSDRQEPGKPTRVPDKPALEGLEAKWSARWESGGVYRFDRSRPREQVYSIDTPPPTVSGSLHVGHVFSFTHTDIIARFKRMRGFSVFYPMGWDDNGLPTERRVQNFFGVRCDPSLPFDPAFTPPDKPGKQPIPVSRPNFIALCEQLTVEDERAFETLWKYLGLSVDWSMTYATIDRRAQRVSQLAFLRSLARGEIYQLEAPTLWDVDFRTAVAQAELDDRELPGAYHSVRFTRPDGGAVNIETTRPELIPACVALVAHPDDDRYRALIGQEVVTPLFGARVPVKAHPLADPEKGSGIAMICTFGDLTDVTWWRELDLPVRAIVTASGTLRPVSWGSAGWESVDAGRAQQHYAELAGLSAVKARAKIVELLGASGDLVGAPRPIVHKVKFYEKGDRPLEIVTSRQWFMKTIELQPALIARGRELEWHPPYMESRYENWVNGLNGDWCVSRQRFFGVPFPVWYRVDADGQTVYASPLLAREDRLPVDPSTDVPDGYRPEQRGLPGGFVGDPDVMDTWATSSLSPQIVGRWEEDPDLFARVFPMDLRPQAHDIIRTWLFYTILRAHVEHDTLPWRHAALSGWILDPDRKKMSKSKGNVVTPMHLLEEHGSDAVRYWAARGGPGVDTAFDVGQMRVGRRLAIKLLNAARFALTQGEPAGAISAAIDRGLVTRLARLVDDVTGDLDEYNYTRALERTESSFWDFCDNYLELIKSRRYGDQGAEGAGSANAATQLALSVFERLLAPYLPFSTEEVWSWSNDGSVHQSSWPTSTQLLAAIEGSPDPAAELALDTVTAVLGEVRKKKSEGQKPLKTPVTRLVVKAPEDAIAAIERARTDLCAAGYVQSLESGVADALSVDVELGELAPMSEAGRP